MIGFQLVLALHQAAQPPPLVTISASDLARAPRLTISPQPVWRIGGDAEGPYGFTRVAGGTFTRGQRAAVLETKPSEVRIYDAAGKHMFSFGRAGRGPGEFEEVLRLVPHSGDSLVVSQVSGMSVFDARGNFARTVSSVNTAAGYVAAVRVFPNGAILVRRHRPPPRVRTEGIRRETARLLILSPLGDKALHDLGEHLFSETVVARAGEAFVFTARAFSTGRLVEGGDSLVFSIQSDSLSMTVLSAQTGRRLRTIAFGLTRRPVSAQDRASFAKGRRAEATSDRWRAMTEAYLKIMPYPETMPYVDALQWSFDGFVRLRRYVAPSDTVASWISLTSTGRLLSTIELPAKARVLDFDRDRVLLVERDADDLEYVAVYRLVPPAG